MCARLVINSGKEEEVKSSSNSSEKPITVHLSTGSSLSVAKGQRMIQQKMQVSLIDYLTLPACKGKASAVTLVVTMAAFDAFII